MSVQIIVEVEKQQSKKYTIRHKQGVVPKSKSVPIGQLPRCNVELYTIDGALVPPLPKGERTRKEIDDFLKSLNKTPKSGNSGFEVRRLK